MDKQSNDNLPKEIEKLNADYKNTLKEVNYNVFKNDQLYGQRLKELKKYSSKVERDSVGLVVGPGALLSSLPELPCKILIVSDYNDYVIETTKYVQAVFEKCETVTEFISKLYDVDKNPYFAQLIDKYGIQTFHEFRDTQIEALGNMHVEYSQMRFLKCKEAYKQKVIEYLKIDFNDADRIGKIGEVMKSTNKVITFADFSNVHQYSGDVQEYAEGLKTLPFSNEVLIFHSKSVDGAMLETQSICQNLHVYLKGLPKINIRRRGEY